MGRPGKGGTAAAAPKKKPGPKPLSTKQRAFIEEYLTNGRNAAEAYRVVYRSTAKPGNSAKMAFELMKRPAIAELVARAQEKAAAATEVVLDRYALDMEGVVRRLTMIALVDPRDLFTWGAGKVTLKSSSELSEEVAYAVAEIGEGADGRLKIKLHDRRQALMDIAKIRGWITDKQANVGPDGKPIDPRQTFVLKMERD